MSFYFVPEQIEISTSYVKTVVLVLGSLAFAGIAIAMLIWVELTPFQRLVMWIGAFFFSLCAVGWLWRFVMHRGAVVTINTRGIRDIRIAKEFIPWDQVLDISIWQHERQKFVVLRVDPAYEAHLSLTKTVRWGKSANSALGMNGFAVAPHGLETDFRTLLETCLDFWRRHSAQTKGP